MYMNDDNKFFISNIFLHVAHLYVWYEIFKKKLLLALLIVAI